ncbi:MAG: AAA family ATPase [Gordonia sp. (in: high G+C Gram-positive bacteria)]
MSGFIASKLADLDPGDSAGPTSMFRMGRARSPESLREMLNGAILGQDEAVAAVVRALTIAAAGISDPHRPIASLLLAGPTGVGKTELARRLAAAITGDPEKLCRIDMNSLAQEHYAASLSGAPPGYSGAKEQFTLFDRKLIEGNPSRPGIVLFDEVEKAHTTVLRSLLQILDTGRLRLTAGTSTIDFRNSVVLLTSNLGSAQLAAQRKQSRGAMSGLRRRLRHDGIDPTLRAVEEFFDPELYNRFDEVISFSAISHDTAAAIVDRELRLLAGRLARQDIHWQPTAAINDYLTATGFDPVYGARNLKRTIRLRLHSVIAEAIVEHPGGPPMHIRTEVVGERIVASAAAEPPHPPVAS